MMSVSPESIRTSVLGRIRQLSDTEISERSSRIISSVSQQADWSWKGRTVALYRSLPSEVRLAGFERLLLREGAKLCFPRILDSKSATMEFVKVEDPNHPKSWERGPYGETEPNSAYPKVSPEEIEIIVVPGLAFGRAGERVGRGKGYYDRFLPGCPTALRLALAFDFQLFHLLPQNPWDQRVNQIITETERVRIG